MNSSPVSTYVRLLGSDCNPGITNKATPDHGLDLEVDVLELEPVYCVWVRGGDKGVRGWCPCEIVTVVVCIHCTCVLVCCNIQCSFYSNPRQACEVLASRQGWPGWAGLALLPPNTQTAAAANCPRCPHRANTLTAPASTHNPADTTLSQETQNYQIQHLVGTHNS